MEWIAHCTICGELDRAPNGPMMESTARLHRRDTGHTTLIGYEPSIIMSGEMKEIDVERMRGVQTRDRAEEVLERISEPLILGGYYWEVTNMNRGEVYHRLDDMGQLSIEDAVKDAKSIINYEDYRDITADHLVIKVYTKSAAEREGITYTPEHTESYWVTETESSRPFPQTYGDWVNLAEDIKTRDPDLAFKVNYNLGLIQLELPGAEYAKRWLLSKAGELGINIGD